MIDGLYINRPNPDTMTALFGMTGGVGTIQNLGLTNVNITGYRYVGAFVGQTGATTFNNCYSTGTVTGTNVYSGGFVGIASGATFNRCNSTVQVNGSSYVGGLIGYSVNSSINNSYYSGTSVNGSVNVGGLVGRLLNSSVTNCYSKTDVNGSTNFGGLIGIDDGGNTYSGNYWDYQTAGLAQTKDIGSIGDNANIFGSTTVGMKNQTTYTGWDFGSIWGIQENIGTPYHRWQYSELSGTVYQDTGTTLVGSGVNISLNFNGVSLGTATTNASGNYSLLVGTGSVNVNDVLLAYIDGNGSYTGNLLNIYDGATTSGFDIYNSTVIARGDNGTVTNSTFSTAKGGIADADILFSLSGLDLSLTAGKDLLIWVGDSYTPGGNVTTNDLTISTTSTLNAEANSINVSGNWTATGNFNAGTGNVNFNGGGTSNLTSGGVDANHDFSTLTVSNGTILNQIQGVLASNLNVTNGTYDLNGQNLTVSDTFSNNGTLRMQGGETVALTMDTNSGTVEYDGGAWYASGSGLACGNDYYNLTFSNSGFWSPNNTLTVNNNLSILNGTLMLEGNDLTVNGTFTNETLLTLQGDETLNLTMDADSGQVEYVGSGNYLGGLAGGNDYFTLLISGTGTWRPNGNLQVNQNLYLYDGVLELDGHNASVILNYANNGAILRLNGNETLSFSNDIDSGTVEYDGAGVYASLSAGNDYYNVVFSGTGTYAHNGNFNVANDITLSSGTLTSDAALYTFDVSGDFMFNGGVFIRSTGGDGTILNPYQVIDDYGLQGIGTNLNSNYIINSNIDLSSSATWNGGLGFNPIGDNVNPFTGTLNGNNNVISNLTINRPAEDYVGLIGYANGATISDLTLNNFSIIGNDNIGSVAGVISGNTTISNINVTGSVAGNQNVGGLTGQNISSTVSVASVNSLLTGVTFVGGVTGFDNAGVYSNVTWSSSTAGIALNQASGNLGILAGITDSDYVPPAPILPPVATSPVSEPISEVTVPIVISLPISSGIPTTPEISFENSPALIQEEIINENNAVTIINDTILLIEQLIEFKFETDIMLGGLEQISFDGVSEQVFQFEENAAIVEIFNDILNLDTNISLGAGSSDALPKNEIETNLSFDELRKENIDNFKIEFKEKIDFIKNLDETHITVEDINDWKKIISIFKSGVNDLKSKLLASNMKSDDLVKLSEIEDESQLNEGMKENIVSALNSIKNDPDFYVKNAKETKEKSSSELKKMEKDLKQKNVLYENRGYLAINKQLSYQKMQDLKWFNLQNLRNIYSDIFVKEVKNNLFDDLMDKENSLMEDWSRFKY
ncbi:MAG: hemagglutinin-like protein [uncultured bacterium]|nr:MAG: hemagglutinin-like protein [uncultured bacterium]